MTTHLLRVLGALIVLFYFHFWLDGYRHHPAFEAAEQYALTAVPLHEALGTDVRVGRYPRGRVRKDAGTAELTLPVRGDGAGMLKLSLQRSTAADWRVVGAELTTGGTSSRLPTRDSTNVRSAEARAARGSALYQRRMHAEALAVLDSAIVDNSRHAPAHFWRGYVLQAIGDQQAARAAFQAAVSLAPDNAESLLALGSAHGRLGDLGPSLVVLDRAIAIDSQHARAWFARALTHGTMGDTAKSWADLATACELGHDRACALRRREGR